MGFFDRFKAAPRRARPAAIPLTQWQAAPPRRDSAALLRAYRDMPWLRTVVDTVADGTADLAWRIYTPKTARGERQMRGLARLRGLPRAAAIKSLVARGDLEEDATHPALAVIDHPTDYLTGRAVWRLVQVYLDLVGEAFLVKDSKGGEVGGLWPVPPTWVVRMPDLRLARSEQRYTITAAGTSIEFNADDVIHLHHPDPSDPLGRGVGAASALADELDTDEYASRFTKNFFFNNALPAAVISITGLVAGQVEEAKKFKKGLVDAHGGPDRAGHVMITGGEVSIARLDTNLEEMTFVELRTYLRDFVRMCYRVPPEIVGDISSSNRATAHAAREILAEQCIVPRAEFLRTELQAWLVDAFNDGAILDYDSPVPADREHQLKVMETVPQAFSYNEWRALAGFAPDPRRQGYPLPLPGAIAEDVEEADATEDEGEEPEDAGRERAFAPPPWLREPSR